MLDTALSWLDLGIAPIPIEPNSKRPAVAWKRYQSRLPSIHQVQHWFYNFDFNLGIVTGWENLVVVDFDSLDAYKLWYSWSIASGGIAQLVASTGYKVLTARGVHIYVAAKQSTAGCIVKGQIDIKAAGGYVLAPPSFHPSGAQYRDLNPGAPILNVGDLQRLFPFALSYSVSEREPVKLARRELALDPWSAAANPRPVGNGNLVELVKRSVKIEDLLTQYKPQSNGRGNRWLYCCCPFHDDHNPSFWIDTKRQLCGCYAGCTQKPLDVINLYAELHNISNSDAVRELADSL